MTQPKGPEAARLRQRRREFRHQLRSLPEDALLGSLSLSYGRCGKPRCRCVAGEGHPRWQFTFMKDGKKRVEAVPAAWVDEVRRRVEDGRAFKEALTEVCAANAELWVLERKQRARKPKKRK
jgi:hypothetical protein